MGILQNLANEVAAVRVKKLLPIIKAQIIRNSEARGILCRLDTFEWEPLIHETDGLLGYGLIQENPLNPIPVSLMFLSIKGEVDWGDKQYFLLDTLSLTQFLSAIQAEVS